jgi:hypothetical protein
VCSAVDVRPLATRFAVDDATDARRACPSIVALETIAFDLSMDLTLDHLWPHALTSHSGRVDDFAAFAAA